jgi:uncharacterized protein YjbJ (UPF0337 family)
MNQDQFEGKWEQLKGQVKVKWGKLTDNDLTVIKGRKDQLIGKIREHYGYTVEQADKELGAFKKECHCSDDNSKIKNQTDM